jgi:hypothetical protein
MRLSADDVLSLARTYADCIGISLTTVGVRAANNDKMFVNLARGRTCTVRSLERAAAWFGANWPKGLPWPEGIPRPEAPGCSGRAA